MSEIAFMHSKTMCHIRLLLLMSVSLRRTLFIFSMIWRRKIHLFCLNWKLVSGTKKHFYKGVGRRKESSLCFKDLYNKLTQIKAYAQTTAVNGIVFDEAKNKRNGHTGGKIYDCLLPFFGLTGTDLGNHLLDLLFFLIYESVSINLL